MLTSDILKIGGFCVSGILSIALMGFSCVMLGLGKPNEVVYYSMLSSIVSVWVPSPINFIKTSDNIIPSITLPKQEEQQKSGVELV